MKAAVRIAALVEHAQDDAAVVHYFVEDDVMLVNEGANVFGELGPKAAHARYACEINERIEECGDVTAALFLAPGRHGVVDIAAK